MKTTFIAAALFAACALPAAAADAQKQLPPVEEVSLPPHGRVYDHLTAELGIPLHFSVNQQTRISDALLQNVDKAMERNAVEYQARAERARKVRFKLGDLSFKILTHKAGLPEEIRDMLTPQQREVFDRMVFDGYLAPVKTKGLDNDEYTREEKEITIMGPDGTPVKKRVIIRRRKKPADQKAAAGAPGDKADSSIPVEEVPAGAFP